MYRDNKRWGFAFMHFAFMHLHSCTFYDIQAVIKSIASKLDSQFKECHHSLKTSTAIFITDILLTKDHFLTSLPPLWSKGPSVSGSCVSPSRPVSRPPSTPPSSARAGPPPSRHSSGTTPGIGSISTSTASPVPVSSGRRPGTHASSSTGARAARTPPSPSGPSDRLGVRNRCSQCFL